ncbi:MAG: hypothetical protein NTZ40_01135 [Cyanobacteria bacterium]|nr:hypothetical protein [Cyanobacteriota bacterium]
MNFLTRDKQRYCHETASISHRKNKLFYSQHHAHHPSLAGEQAAAFARIWNQIAWHAPVDP